MTRCICCCTSCSARRITQFNKVHNPREPLRSRGCIYAGKFSFSGESPLTIRAWQPGGDPTAPDCARFDGAVVNFRLALQKPIDRICRGGYQPPAGDQWSPLHSPMGIVSETGIYGKGNDTGRIWNGRKQNPRCPHRLESCGFHKFSVDREAFFCYDKWEYNKEGSLWKWFC